MRIHLLALDGLFDTGLAAVLDAFALANKLALQQKGHGAPPFDVSVVGVKTKVRSGLGRKTLQEIGAEMVAAKKKAPRSPAQPSALKKTIDAVIS